MKIFSHFSAATILLSCVTFSMATSIANARPPFSTSPIPSHLANTKTIEGTLREVNGENIGYIPCNNITVNLIRVTPVEGRNGIYPQKVLASAVAVGNTLGNSCNYSLKVKDSPSVSTIVNSYHVMEISAPRINSCYIAQSFSSNEHINRPFPNRVDMGIGKFFTCPK
jgi:hypothetical protein